jgi:hypothetical protein
MHDFAVCRNCVDEQTETLLSAGGGWHEGGGEVPGSSPARELESVQLRTIVLADLLPTPSQVELASVNCKCCCPFRVERAASWLGSGSSTLHELGGLTRFVCRFDMGNTLWNRLRFYYTWFFWP